MTAPGGSPVEVVVFDVNETLSDLEPLRDRLAAAGAPGHLLETWFAGTLRDGFALAAAGGAAPFRQVGTEVLRGLLGSVRDLDRSPDLVAEQVLDGFAELRVHPDVVQGMRLLHEAGLRLVTLTNGATSVSQALLAGAGIDDLFEQQLSVEDAGHWKPHPAAYAWAVERCGARPDAMLMVAVHPWDLHGAAGAGLLTGWVNRRGVLYPGMFRRPTWSAADLPALAEQVIAGDVGVRAAP